MRKMGGEPADFPLWLITTKSMQYSAGNNVGIPLMNEVGGNMRGHGGVILNVATAERLDICQVWSKFVRSPQPPAASAVLEQGIRPDTVVIVGQFDHWTPPPPRICTFRASTLWRRCRWILPIYRLRIGSGPRLGPRE